MQSDDMKEAKYDFVLTPGLLFTTNHAHIEDNNNLFGSVTPQHNGSSDVAVKFKKLSNDCIATVAIEGEGVYQIFVNKSVNLEEAQMFDKNTFLRFQDIIETAKQMANSDSFKSSTKNTNMNF